MYEGSYVEAMQSAVVRCLLLLVSCSQPANQTSNNAAPATTDSSSAAAAPAACVKHLINLAPRVGATMRTVAGRENHDRADRRPTTNQPRAAGGPAVGCVVRRWPAAMGHRRTTAGDSAPRDRGRIRRRGSRCGMWDGRERRYRLPRRDSLCWESTWPRRRCRSHGTRLTLAGSDAEFVVADALHLDRLGRRFETVLDCGLFHRFDSDERRDYVANLAAVTSPGSQPVRALLQRRRT